MSKNVKQYQQIAQTDSNVNFSMNFDAEVFKLWGWCYNELKNAMVNQKTHGRNCGFSRYRIVT